MTVRLALAALLLLAHTSFAHEFMRVRALSSTETSTAVASKSTGTVSAPVSVKSSLASVCTPSQCIQGANSLRGLLS